MPNPHPDVFTEADIQAINADLGKRFQAHLELDRLADKVRDWFKRDAEGHWLALGLDIVTDGVTTFYGGPTKPRFKLKDLLEDSLHDDEEYAFGGSRLWTKDTETIARVWLDISPYGLWKLINKARKAALDTFDEQLIFLAAGDDNGSSVATVAEEVFADAVRRWRDAQTEGSNPEMSA